VERLVRIRGRFFVEVGLAVALALLSLATIVWRDWIERVFGADPDGGRGSLEALILAALVLVAVACSALARLEWRRARCL
jgi:hypothetical protein